MKKLLMLVLGLFVIFFFVNNGSDEEKKPENNSGIAEATEVVEEEQEQTKTESVIPEEVTVSAVSVTESVISEEETTESEELASEDVEDTPAPNESEEEEEKAKYIEMGNYADAPLEWIVLATEGDQSLLITKEIIDYKDFNETVIAEGTDWEHSTIRQWLNEDFYNDVFSDEEKSAIQRSNVQDYKADHELGDQTQDYLFLLSVDQAFSYFTTDRERVATPTEYAKRQIKFPQNSWWLIDSYSSDLYKYLISPQGNLKNQPRVNESEGVRPAMWVFTTYIE